MSQQGSLRFPMTRLLEADYGTILAKQVQDHDQVKSLECALSGNKEATSGPDSPILPLPSPNLSSTQLEGCGSSDYASLLRQLNYMKKQVSWREQNILEARPLVQALICAARKDPASTAHTLSSRSGRGPRICTGRRRGRLRCAGSSSTTCDQVPLPLSRFCLQHQCLDCTQVLYRSCCSLAGGSGQERCGATVLDIFSSPPLCPKHSSPEGPPRKKLVPQQHPVLSGSKRTSKDTIGKLVVMGKTGSLSAGKKQGGVVKGGAVLKPGTVVKGTTVLKAGPAGTKVVRKAAVQPGTLLHNKVISLVKLKSAEILSESKSSSSPSIPAAVILTKSTAVPAKLTPMLKTTPPLVTTESVKSSATLDDLLTLSSSLTAPKLDLLPLQPDIGDIMMAGEDSSGEDM